MNSINTNDNNGELKFNSLNLSREILANLESLKFRTMTPIQAKSLPVILEGKDVIAQAKTGSGKTAAFALGILSKLNNKDFSPQALILCPTRELAEQVAIEIRRLASFTSNIKVLSLCGGSAEYFQVRSLEHGGHILVGTPGRVLRLLDINAIRLTKINTLVFDEADRMLDMGFIDDVKNITSYLPANRQTLLFSATYSKEVLELSRDLQNKPEEIKVDVTHEENAIKQVFVKVENQESKGQALMNVLAQYKPTSTIIFCRTKQTCQNLEYDFNQANIEALALHGDLEQRDRNLVLTKFSNKSCLILVATDVAARGLDVKNLSLVINYDLPTNAEDYTHRIGRTGRAGKEGLAVSLVTSKDLFMIKKITDILKISPEIISNDLLKMNANDEYNLTPPMRTMYISGGRKDKIRPGDILGALTKDAAVSADKVGDIKIMDMNSYVAIATDEIENVLEKLQNSKIKGKKFRLGIL